MIQAEIKLKQNKESWTKDQLEALQWAEQTFEKMDPGAKEDIKKFQEKLEKIDREIDKQSKLVLACHVDYYAIREEFNALSDKKKALE